MLFLSHHSCNVLCGALPGGSSWRQLITCPPANTVVLGLRRVAGQLSLLMPGEVDSMQVHKDLNAYIKAAMSCGQTQPGLHTIQ